MKKGRWTPIAIFALVMLAVGYGLWYGSQVYIPGLNAEKAEIIRAEQEAEAAKLAAAESTDTADAVPYDYSIPIDEEALRQQAEQRAIDPEALTTETIDDNGETWIDRDYASDLGGKEIPAPDPNENTGGATANIAGDASSIPTDGNGVYYETFPEALGTTPGTTNSNGSSNGGGNGNGSNGGSTAAPGSNPANSDAGGASGNGGTGSGGALNSSGTPNGGNGSGTSTPGSNEGGGNGGSNGGGNGNGSGNNGGSTGTSNGGSGSGAVGGSSSSTSGGGGGSSGSPKSGDVKYVDGQRYVYNSIFGWVQSDDNGGHSYSTQSAGTATELGERVENASF